MEDDIYVWRVKMLANPRPEDLRVFWKKFSLNYNLSYLMVKKCLYHKGTETEIDVLLMSFVLFFILKKLTL